MPVRHAEATWQGSLRDGKGTMRFGDGLFEGAYSFPSRFEEGSGTNPEELLGAAHAGCFSMALSSRLTQAGRPPEEIRTKASVSIEKVEGDWTVTRVHLETEAKVLGIGEAALLEAAEHAKKGCPISRALVGGPEITLEAKLIN
ncbi:MAG: OsmC family peroxiredoxin [Anaerolineae bacterium]